jgi:protein regulator of cytokinesis 1
MVPYEPCSVCSGLVDPSELLENIEEQIVKAKEEAVGRKEIMDRIDRWLSACEEENWLEDYNQVSWNFVL